MDKNIVDLQLEKQRRAAARRAKITQVAAWAVIVALIGAAAYVTFPRPRRGSSPVEVPSSVISTTTTSPSPAIRVGLSKDEMTKFNEIVRAGQQYLKRGELESFLQLISAHNTARTMGCAWLGNALYRRADDHSFDPVVVQTADKIKRAMVESQITYGEVFKLARGVVPTFDHEMVKRGGDWMVKHVVIPQVAYGVVVVVCEESTTTSASTERT